MQRAEKWVRSLPTATLCGDCQAEVYAPDWRVTSKGRHMVAINFAQCQQCGNMIVGAAGSTPEATKLAQKIWQEVMDELGKKKAH